MASPDKYKDGEESDAKFLKGAFGGVGLITAWIFVLGWTYLYTYYASFGININSLNFPIYHYLVFFFAQFVSFGWRGLSLGILLVAAFGLAWAGTSSKRKRTAFFVSVGYLALFWLGFYVARNDARETALSDMGLRSRRPVISVQFKEPMDFESAAVEASLASAQLRLLLENGDQMYVFRPVDTSTTQVLVQVIAMNRNDVYVSIRTERSK